MHMIVHVHIAFDQQCYQDVHMKHYSIISVIIVFKGRLVVGAC